LARPRPCCAALPLPLPLPLSRPRQKLRGSAVPRPRARIGRDIETKFVEVPPRDSVISGSLLSRPSRPSRPFPAVSSLPLAPGSITRHFQTFVSWTRFDRPQATHATANLLAELVAKLGKLPDICVRTHQPKGRRETSLLRSFLFSRLLMRICREPMAPRSSIRRSIDRAARKFGQSRFYMRYPRCSCLLPM
jgi:hypothetical protein